MAKKANGLFAGSKLLKRRQKFRMLQKRYRYLLRKRTKPSDALLGAPQGNGIVLEKLAREPRKPHSGLRKCVRVQLIKNGRQITAFVPGDGAIKKVDEHDEVTIEGMHGRMGRSFGDLPGIKYKVSKVNGVSLRAIMQGKKEKKRR
jgi:small subunit ribosomal protein S12